MITRYNYEEYFLLYVDNELSAAERDAVEEFIQQNADLEEELNMLKQSVIKPENNIFFDNKNSLLKHIDEVLFINLNNYEEYFLLYVDNELPDLQKIEVEKFVRQNPSLQNEFMILQQTKLEADDSIVFEGKEFLYKKEEHRRVVPFAWIASAAAVAILLVTGFLFFNKENITRKNQNNTVAKNSGIKKDDSNGHKIKDNKKETLAVTSSDNDSLNKSSEEQKRNVAINQTKFEAQPKNSIEKKKKEIEAHKEQQTELAINNNEPAIAKVTKPEELNRTTASASVDVSPKKLIVLIDKTDDAIKNNNETNPAEITSTENDLETKTKLRGIFRRVSRVFNKPSDDDDSNKRSVAIGSFQIALK